MRSVNSRTTSGITFQKNYKYAKRYPHAEEKGMKKKIVPLIVMLLLFVGFVSPSMAWFFERPGDYVTTNQRTEEAYTDGNAVVGLGVHALSYHELAPDPPSNGYSFVTLQISATANARQLISYAQEQIDSEYSWISNLPYTLSLPDDGGGRIRDEEMPDCGPRPIRFYGGPDSCEYDFSDIWITSNGVISFDHYATFTDPYYDFNIPDTGGPNSFVAPLWKDLNPEEHGSITYGVVELGNGTPWLCISWNDIPDKCTGAWQSFQVLIEAVRIERCGSGRQNDIIFQYKNVNMDDPKTVVGFEDQVGGKGVSVSDASIGNGRAILSSSDRYIARIATLGLRIDENDPYAYTEIAGGAIKGYNVILDEDLPEDPAFYQVALSGVKSLLSYATSNVVGQMVFAAGLCTPGVGLVALGTGVLFDLGMTAIEYFARQQRMAELFNTDGATYAYAHARDYEDSVYYISTAVDASLDITLYWILTEDPPNLRLNHELTVTAELAYTEYDVWTGYPVELTTTTIPVSVTINTNKDNNNEYDSGQDISPGAIEGLWIGRYDTVDYYHFNAQAHDRISIRARWEREIMGDPLLLSLTVKDPYLNSIGPSAYLDDVKIDFVAGVAGEWCLLVQPFHNGFYNITLDIVPGSPVCAMKTRINGAFYVPNLSVNCLRIELLFSDPKLEGDQTQGTSRYPTITRWPSGSVTAADWVFVRSLIPALEGGPNWDYMADVNGDGVIDGKDYVIVRGNVPSSGTYFKISDLTGVTVLFNTGSEATPDTDGDLTLPQGCASFTVLQNGNPIGALVTFWQD